MPPVASCRLTKPPSLATTWASCINLSTSAVERFFSLIWSRAEG